MNYLDTNVPNVNVNVKISFIELFVEISSLLIFDNVFEINKYIEYSLSKVVIDLYGIIHRSISIKLRNNVYGRCSSRQKQGAGIEAVRRPGYRYINHCDRDASGGNHVHFLQESKVEGCPHAFDVLRPTRRLEGKINSPPLFLFNIFSALHKEYRNNINASVGILKYNGLFYSIFQFFRKYNSRVSSEIAA